MTLMICILPCIPFACICCISEDKIAACYSLVTISVFCLFLGFWIWWIVDWLLIITNSLPDASGFPLKQDL